MRYLFLFFPMALLACSKPVFVYNRFDGTDRTLPVDTVSVPLTDNNTVDYLEARKHADEMCIIEGKRSFHVVEAHPSPASASYVLAYRCGGEYDAPTIKAAPPPQPVQENK